MSENDPDRLAGQLEEDADQLGRGSRQLKGKVQEAREDWRRKRADSSIPGAPPTEEDEDQPEQSESSEAPPEGAEPAASETTSEGAAGRPSDPVDEDDEG